MRATLRLLASAKPGQYLENFAPTGLTGIVTHPSPRPTLIYIYNKTLSRLKQIPESSVYRQSTEAFTRQRLNIVESVKPPGFEAWLQRVQTAVENNPAAFEPARTPDGGYAAVQTVEEANPEGEPWEGRHFTRQSEGAYLNEEEMETRKQEIKQEMEEAVKTPLEWEQEPSLEASQVSELENKIGAGLIEEVIQAAQGELSLLRDMIENKAWEDLEVKPKPGQWTYFERTGGDRS